MYISKNEKKKKDVKLFYYHLLNINVIKIEKFINSIHIFISAAIAAI